MPTHLDALAVAVWPLFRQGLGREAITERLDPSLHPTINRVRERMRILRPYLNAQDESLPPQLTGKAPPSEAAADVFQGRVSAYASKIEEAPLHLLVKEAVKVQAVADQIIGALQGMVAPYEDVDWSPPVWPEKPGRPRVLLCLRSDQHVGKRQDAEGTGGIGRYGMDLFEERLRRHEEGILNILHRESWKGPVHGITMANLGDTVDGHSIYPGHAYNLQLNAMQQVMQGAELIAASDMRILRALAEVSDGILEEVGIGGNHGRGDPKKGAAPYAMNWDLVLYHFAALRHSNEARIRWHIPNAPWLVHEVAGERFLLTHGDVIRSWMGLPFYGIERYDMRMSKTLAQHGIPPHRYLAIGDKHVPGYVYNWFVNGAYPGGDDFSVTHLGTAARPCQMVLTVEQGFGVSAIDLIWLEDLHGSLSAA